MKIVMRKNNTHTNLVHISTTQQFRKKPKEFWSRENTRSAAAEDGCTSKIFAASADQKGKSSE